MRHLHRYVIIACLVIFCANGLLAQGLDSLGGPYTADANTVLLLHFDGNYSNAAAALGKTATNAVARTTNPAKIYFLPNTGVAGMGQCVRIDNSSINDSSYITVDDTASFDMTGNWTIEAWANIFTFGASSSDYRWVPRVVMKPGDDVFYLPNYWLEMWGDNRLFHAGFYTTASDWISISSPNNMFVPGEWVHLTFIRDTVRAFIAVMVHDANKNLKGFISKGFDKAKDIPLINKQKVHIGWAGAVGIATASTDSWLDGFVDEVRISNVVRNFAGPPVVSSVTVLPNQPSTLTSYPVTVSVFPLNAGGSIASAVLKYRTDTTGAFASVTMVSAGGNDYTASIPAQSFKTRIQYYVVCTDNNGFKSLSPVDAEAMTNPSYYSFLIFQPNVKTLDLTFEEGPGKTPVDASTNNATIKTHKYAEYSTDRPAGGGQYSWLIQPHAGEVVDSNWVEAESPFLAAEEFTLDAWINADSANTYARIIINPTKVDDWNNANFELSLRPNAQGKVAFTSRYWRIDGSGAVVLQDSNDLVTMHIGKWRHVILERNKTTGEFAMAIRDENDQLMFKTTKTDMKAPLMAGAPLRIGRSWFLVEDYWYVPPFRGKIDNVKVYNYPAGGLTTDVSEDNGVPLVFDLEQNYPNPFNPSTQVRFTIPKFQQVSLVIFDVLGRKVKTLLNEERHAGQHRVTWDGTNDAGFSVATGVYFYELRAGDFTKTQKMLLIR